VNLIETGIAGAWIAESPVGQDHRGAFSRLFCANELGEAFGQREIVQINHSMTRNVGAVRGMHFQYAPHAEMKIVRCLKGRVFDVAVDLRTGSETFMNWEAVELTPKNNHAFIIPEGCAHGFQVLEEDSQLMYLHTNFYTPAVEGAIKFDEPKVGVDWPLKPQDLSERDLSHPYLDDDYQGISICNVAIAQPS
jgi:dTDP-4-dehydrorhamnose 3,5-epimerase